MKLLILGGTRFLGRHLAQQALDAGHRVTLLHRGRSGPGLFPQAEHRIADRDAELQAALAGGTWDAAIDTSAFLPRQVQDAVRALAGRVGQYQLVSSISAYADFVGNTQEDAPLQALADPAVQTVSAETYGGLKARCEAAAGAGFGERCLISRPGLLVGPCDPTGRYTWWAQRFVQAAAADAGEDGEVLAPGNPLGPVQCIDCRDAAAWMLRQAEAGCSGCFNLTGPAQALTMGDFLRTAQAALAPAARLLWVDEDFLLARGVVPWTELPVWLPAAQSATHRMDIARALASGLQCRPLAQTFADTAAWAATAAPPPLSGPLRPAVGMTSERERALRAAWRAR